MKKILVLGGTGAMGVYLVPELLRLGYRTDVVSLDEMTSDNPNLTYSKGNARDDEFLKDILKNNYDAIVDFMIYDDTEKFKLRRDMILDSTEHYLFLSSYRVYAEDKYITEESPRLLDVSDDCEFLKTNDYSLYKARGEDVLRAAKSKNYSILRPAITYSKRRFQLVTLEAYAFLPRIRQGKTVVLPEEAMDIQATMSWAGDVAKLIAALVLNKKAYGETYTVSTAEHNSWRTVAEYYRELQGMKYITVPKKDYLKITGADLPGKKCFEYQLLYDRMLNRRIDNSKILDVTGYKQTDFISLKDGLARELSGLPEVLPWDGRDDLNKRMDDYLINFR